MKRLLLIAILLFAGCEKSYMKITGMKITGKAIKQPVVMDANKPVGCEMVELKGKPAEIVSQQLADNMKTTQAMTADIFKRSGWLFAGLIIAMVAGFAFWGFTKSRYGWVIPASCIAGIVGIIFFVQFSKWIFVVVLVISGLLLIWKAVEYHTERNVERAKNGK